MIQVNTQERLINYILGSTNNFQTDFQQITRLYLLVFKEIKTEPLSPQTPYTKAIYSVQRQAETPFRIIPKSP